jgi:hypothetical protein
VPSQLLCKNCSRSVRSLYLRDKFQDGNFDAGEVRFKVRDESSGVKMDGMKAGKSLLAMRIKYALASSRV